jgi:hypothetical protein
MADISKCFDLTPIKNETDKLVGLTKQIKMTSDTTKNRELLMSLILSDDVYNSVSSILDKLVALTDENIKCIIGSGQNVCQQTLRTYDQILPEETVAGMEKVVSRYLPLIKTGYTLLIRYMTIYQDHCGLNPAKMNRLIKLINDIDSVTSFLQKFRSCPTCPTCPECKCAECKCPEVACASNKPYQVTIGLMGLVIAILIGIIIYLSMK